MLRQGLRNGILNGLLVGSLTIGPRCHHQRLDKRLHSSLHSVTMLEYIAWSLLGGAHELEVRWLELLRWKGQRVPSALRTKSSEEIPTLSERRSYALPARDSNALWQCLFWSSGATDWTSFLKIIYKATSDSKPSRILSKNLRSLTQVI